MNIRTNVGSDIRASMEASFQAWIAAGCPTADLNCPGPDKDDIIFRLRHKASLMYGEVPELLEEAAVEISSLRHKLEPQVNNPIPFDWKTETDSPIAEMDAIYAEYSKTFGRYPDQFMADTMEKVGLMLVSWWAWHREDIRAALVKSSALPEVNNPAPVFVWPLESPAPIEIPTSWNHSYNPRAITC